MAGNEDINGQRAVGTRQGFDVAYLKARFFQAALYQPLKRLATLVMPRWGFVLQLVSILAKLEISTFQHFNLPHTLLTPFTPFTPSSF